MYREIVVREEILTEGYVAKLAPGRGRVGRRALHAPVQVAHLRHEGAPRVIGVHSVLQ